jgi:OmpA-OmpF porin, OOP family
MGTKNMNHARKCVVASLLVASSSGVARADDTGVYFGAGLGEAKQSATGFEGSGGTFTVFGGYSFNAYVAAEAGYIDGGKQTDHRNGLDLAVSSDGFVAAGIVKLPLGRFVAPYAKVGYVFYDSRTRISAGSQSLTSTESDENPLYGLGCEFKIGEHARIRVEYDQVDVDDADFDITSLNFAWRF